MSDLSRPCPTTRLGPGFCHVFFCRGILEPSTVPEIQACMQHSGFHIRWIQHIRIILTCGIHSFEMVALTLPPKRDRRSPNLLSHQSRIFPKVANMKGSLVEKMGRKVG